MCDAYRRHHTARLQEVADLVGPEAARLAAIAYRDLQGAVVAGVVFVVCGIWLERRGPTILSVPLAVAALAWLGFFAGTVVMGRRMNRAASQHVSEALGHPVTLVPNQFVLRRSSWESAIERAKRAHERQVAEKQQRWHL